jgi:hypothetical protein
MPFTRRLYVRPLGDSHNELIRSQNQSQAIEHALGTSYFPSVALTETVARAHHLFVRMTPLQRRAVLHPRYLDQWFEERRIVTVVACDLEVAADLPDLFSARELPDP